MVFKFTRKWSPSETSSSPSSSRAVRCQTSGRLLRVLLWKNFKLIARQPWALVSEMMSPLILAILLMVLRIMVPPVQYAHPTTYQPFSIDQLPFNNSKFTDLAWSPDNHTEIQGVINVTCQHLQLTPRGFKNEKELENFLMMNAEDKGKVFLAGVSFLDELIQDGCTPVPLSQINQIPIKIRFPSETRFPPSITKASPFSPRQNWMTNLLFPSFPTRGPREPNSDTGGNSPGYYAEGFLALQHSLGKNLIRYLSHDLHSMPQLEMRRLPYPAYVGDDLVNILQIILPVVVMLCFLVLTGNTSRGIAEEREQQIKECMKAVGLLGWLHWLAWFIRSFLLLGIPALFFIGFCKLPLGSMNARVLAYANITLLFGFIIVYVLSVISFAFMISVFFKKASNASACAYFAAFASYVPYMFLQRRYETLNMAEKMFACLAHNTAMSFGVQLILVNEGTGSISNWYNMFKPMSKLDPFCYGHTMVMLLVDSVIYMIVALYVEAITPGEFGVPLKWYFFLQKSFWSNKPTAVVDEVSTFVEGYLKPGIRIRNLTKVYGNEKIAVNDLTLDINQGQITVLLGHNGAGKTTTMAMLTGMLPPTEGTANISGFDLRSDLKHIRKLLGLCPQHNVLFPKLTVTDHLYFFSKLRGLTGDRLKEEVDRFIIMLGLENKANALSETLSGGQKRRLATAIALCGDSKVVFLDEPTAGMDLHARRLVWDTLRREKSHRTIVLSTHHMDEADLLADQIAVLTAGKLRCHGTPFHLKQLYGGGYRLVIVTSTSAQVPAITDLIQSHIPESRFTSRVGNEVSYNLPSSTTPLFANLFRQLESESQNLAVDSYGVSPATIEDVFIRIGKDIDHTSNYSSLSDLVHSDEELDSSGLSSTERRGEEAFPDSSTLLLTNRNLILSQIYALVIKRVWYICHGWLALISIQFITPILAFIVAWLVNCMVERSSQLGPMPLNLTLYGKTYAPVLLNQGASDQMELAFDAFVNLMKQYPGGSEILGKNETTLNDFMLRKDSFWNATYRFNVGASFGDSSQDKMTAWFSNQPYHASATALGLIQSAWLQGPCKINASIEYFNHPLPYTTSTLINEQIVAGFSRYNLISTIGAALALASSSFSLNIVKENNVRSKQLQLDTGVPIYLFWIITYLCDIIQHVALTGISLLIMILSFQTDGFSGPKECSYMVLLIFLYAMAALPLIYIISRLFRQPTSAFTTITFINIIGLVFFIMSFLLTSYQFTDENDKLRSLIILYISPLYTLLNGFNKLSSAAGLRNVCHNIIAHCDNRDFQHVCCKVASKCPTDGCVSWSEDFSQWDIAGEPIFWLLLDTLIYFSLLMLIEYQIFRKHFWKQFCNDKFCFSNNKDISSHPSFLSITDYGVRKEYETIRSIKENMDLKERFNLVLKNVSKRFGSLQAVSNLWMGIAPGECFGLLGPNGAGKSTTFAMMTGELQPLCGQVLLAGQSPREAACHGLYGYCPQWDALIDELTALETLTLYARLRGLSQPNIETVISKITNRFYLNGHLHKQIRALSGGNRRKISVAVALLGSPKVVFLDEPTAGMDPEARRATWRAVAAARSQGQTIILTSHSMEECEALCTRIGILGNGRLQCIGSAQQLKARFAQGYTLTIKYISTVASVRQWLLQEFPDAEEREMIVSCGGGEAGSGLITFHVPRQEGRGWADVFEAVERKKNLSSDVTNIIEAYSLGQTTLEQVFLSFTKHLNGENNSRNKHKNVLNIFLYYLFYFYKRQKSI